MRTPLKPGVPITVGGGPTWDKVYIVSTNNNGSSAPSIQITDIDNEGNINYVVKTNGQVPYQDGYLRFEYGTKTRYYWTCILQKDALVNDVEQSAGYYFTWGYSGCKTTIFQFN